MKEYLKGTPLLMISGKSETKEQMSSSKEYEVSQLTACSIYDSIYIAISEKLKTQFITADEKLFSRVKKYNYDIVLLKEYLSE